MQAQNQLQAYSKQAEFQGSIVEMKQKQIQPKQPHQKEQTETITVNVTPLQKQAQINIETKYQIPQLKPNPPEMQAKDHPKTITQRLTSMKDNIMAKILAHNRNTNPDLSPSVGQIQQCTRMMQSQFPKHRIDLIIKSLHALFHLNCKQQSEIDDESFHSGSAEASYVNADHMKANILVRQREAVHVPFQTRLTEQQRIAISYLNYGYGVRILREHIRDPSINPTRYNNVITTIMKMAFRKLQDYIKNVGHSIVPLDSQDEKVIRAPLTNCEKWLPPDELQTFYKFIKLACCLQNKLDISSPSAVKLYSSCIRQLKQRQANQQDYRNQKVMRGDRRLPRITHNMYSNSASSIDGKGRYQNSSYPNMTKSNGIIGRGLYLTNPNYGAQPNAQNSQRFRPFGQQYNFSSEQMDAGGWRAQQKLPFV